MERRVKLSDQDGEELSSLADTIAKGTNPQLFFDGNKELQSGETPSAEQKARLQSVKDAMAEKLEGGIFRDWINKI